MKSIDFIGQGSKTSGIFEGQSKILVFGKNKKDFIVPFTILFKQRNIYFRIIFLRSFPSIARPIKTASVTVSYLTVTDDKTATLRS